MSHIASTPETYCTRARPCVLCQVPASCIRCGGTPRRMEPMYRVMDGNPGPSDPYMDQGNESIAYQTNSTEELFVGYDMMSQYTGTEKDSIVYAPGTQLDIYVKASTSQVQYAAGNEAQLHPSLAAHLAMPETEGGYECYCSSTMSQSPSAVEQHLSSAGPSKKASVKGSAGCNERRVSTNRCPPGSACDACHDAKIGCSGFEQGMSCGPCLARHTVCEKTRRIGRAGRPRGTGKKAPVEPEVVPSGSNAHHGTS